MLTGSDPSPAAVGADPQQRTPRQSGLRALQMRRPWRIRLTWTRRRPLGRSPRASRRGPPRTTPSGAAARAGCRRGRRACRQDLRAVEREQQTHAAVLRPTPGSRSRNSIASLARRVAEEPEVESAGLRLDHAEHRLDALRLDLRDAARADRLLDLLDRRGCDRGPVGEAARSRSYAMSRLRSFVFWESTVRTSSSSGAWCGSLRAWRSSRAAGRGLRGCGCAEGGFAAGLHATAISSGSASIAPQPSVARAAAATATGSASRGGIGRVAVGRERGDQDAGDDVACAGGVDRCAGRRVRRRRPRRAAARRRARG